MREITFGEIAEFRNGLNYSKKNFGQGLPVINVKDFGDKTTVDLFSLDEINPHGLPTARSLLEPGDILFVRSNGNKELIGRSVFINEAPPKGLSHSAFTIRARVTSPEVDKRFISFLVRSGVVRRSLSASGSGTNISNLNQDILARLKFDLPPLPIQKRIAAILSAYDDLIEVNTRRIAILEEMARRIYEAWFVRHQCPGGDGTRPVEWRSGKLGDVLALRYGKALKATERRGGPVAVYGSGGIVGWHDSALVRGPGIVVGRKGTVGSIYLSPIDFFPIDTAYFVETEKPLLYIHQLLQTYTFESNDAAVPGLNREYALTRKLLIPPDPLLKSYAETVTPLYELLHTLQRQNTNLRAQRDLLLPRLVSGKLDVSTVDRAHAHANIEEACA